MRDLQRGFLQRTFPAESGDAGRADSGGACPGRSCCNLKRAGEQGQDRFFRRSAEMPFQRNGIPGR